jgi:site-specific DNA-methyltransferase (adenine-specific)
MQLIPGDCLDKMTCIADKSIDMILCDLPYGTTACKWDVIIPFQSLWKQYKRIIKDCGAIVLFGSEPFSSMLRLSNLSMFKYDWIWKKSRKNGYVHAKGMPLREHELISVFSCGGVYKKSINKMQYFPQDTIPFSAKRINYVKTTSAYQGGMEVGSTWDQCNAMYPTSILSFKNESPKTQVHPTQKPIALLEYLIKTYTVDEQCVLDNCMGSGSTGVACVNTNRNFIGIEKDKKYFEIASLRINKALEDKKLNINFKL